MTTQPDLFETPTTPEREEVQLLTALLEQDGGWLTARDLSRILGIDDRRIRHLASLADGEIVSGPGCPGYRHISHCTADEIRHTAERLRSQGRAMLSRSIRLRRRAHSAIG